jgi:multicomponent Na+:H+ antiporter subunit D
VNDITPLVVAIPLIGAPLLAIAALIVGRRVLDAAATAIALAVTGLGLRMLVEVADGSAIHWFGDWEPTRGIALGIDFVVDPISAALATFAAAVVTVALLFSWRYLETVSGQYHVLMLVLLGALQGLALTGDLFNMFVFLELMTVAAIGLAGYQTAESGTLRGVLGFAIVNSVGAFLVLWGIALLYGQTGALNFAQVGEAIAAVGRNPLTTAAFVLIVSGFLVKAAVVPFHFWLVDTYSSAISPVGVVFAAVAGEMGIYAIARVYWTVFHEALSPLDHTITIVLVALGCMTAIVGAVMSFVQRHLRRMLAFGVIAHTGIMLVGIAMLSAEGIAGAIVYIVADGLVKASLFMAAGIVHHQLSDIDELRLHGDGRKLWPAFIVFVIGGLALAGLPPLATFSGKFVIEEGAVHEGYAWVQVMFVLASAITGGAVLRGAGRCFLGWGPRANDERLISRAEVDVEEREFARSAHLPATMLGPAVVLVVALFVGGFVAPLERTVAAAETFIDQQGYAAFVLRAEPLHVPTHAPVEITAGGVLLGIASGALAVALSGLSLLTGRWSRTRKAVEQRIDRLVAPLRTLHRGHIGDFVTWLVVGVAVLGAVLALPAP